MVFAAEVITDQDLVGKSARTVALMEKVMNSARPDKSDDTLWLGGSQNSGSDQEAADVKGHSGVEVPKSNSAPSLEDHELPEKIDSESLNFVMEMRKRRFDLRKAF